MQLYDPTMKVCLFVAMFSCLVPSSEPFRPYVTCVGCDTFLQCFMTCPVADYPGVNRFGVYIPKLLQSIGSSRSSSDPRTKRNLRQTDYQYNNWKPYDPTKYRNYFKLDREWNNMRHKILHIFKPGRTSKWTRIINNILLIILLVFKVR